MAWFELVQHTLSNHPDMSRPAPPDVLTVLRGDWEYSTVRARKTHEVRYLNMAADYGTKLWNYLEEHELIDTPADPFYDWKVRVEAYGLRNGWEAAVIAGSEDEADQALASLLTYLDAHAPFGRQYDPRRRQK